MNLSVSRISHNGRSIHSTAFVLGLLQGGEFVTARARAMVQGTLQYFIHRLAAEPTVREVEGFQIQYLRGPSSVFLEVRRGGEAGLLE